MPAIEFYPEVYTDLKVAYDWYEQQRIGLGEDFLLSLEDAFAKISKQPEHYQAVYKHIRRKLIRRFPYGVYYLIQDDKPIAIAVIHTRRSTNSWKDRTQNKP